MMRMATKVIGAMGVQGRRRMRSWQLRRRSLTRQRGVLASRAQRVVPVGGPSKPSRR